MASCLNKLDPHNVLQILGRINLTSIYTDPFGDFNAKSTSWDSPKTDTKRRAMENWAASIDLCFLNTGDSSTCVRWQGESIVDF